MSLLSVVFERPKVAGFPDPNAEENATMYYDDFLVTYTIAILILLIVYCLLPE